MDAAATTSERPMIWQECVGAGRVGEGLRPAWQSQLAQAARDIGFRSLRCHGLYHDELGVYRIGADGTPVYDFTKVDAVYDAMLHCGVKPFVEFGPCPEALASGTETTFWWKANFSTPKDMGRWAALVQATVRHWVERYGIDEVRSWWFEVWNEPNHPHFLKPINPAKRQQEYFAIYDATVTAVKAVDKALRVGGPAGAGPAWNVAMMKHAKEAGVPLDFVSSHQYAVSGGDGLDEFGRRKLILVDDPQYVAKGVRAVRANIQSGPFPGLPFHLTEWSASYSPRDPIHDSYVSAPFILEQIQACGTAAQSLSYWVFTDIFEEAGPLEKPFEGCFGLLNTDGIRKPAWWAYAFLNRLGNRLLPCTDKRTMATVDAKGRIAVLLWDYRHPIPTQSKISNQEFFVKDHPAADLPPVQLAVSALRAGTWQLEITRVGYRSNDAYTPYLTDLGRPAKLDDTQLARLREASSGRPERQEPIAVQAGQPVNLTIPMHTHDCVLVTFEPPKVP